MKTKKLLNCLAAAAMLASGSASAAEVSTSATAPTVDGLDIANLGAPSGGLLIWSDRPVQGQTFTTGAVISGRELPGPKIASITFVGGDVFEVTIAGEADTDYEFRSSTVLEFDAGSLVEGLLQVPGDPGTTGGPNNSVLTTDSSGAGTVRMTLTGDPSVFIRAQTTP